MLNETKELEDSNIYRIGLITILTSAIMVRVIELLFPNGLNEQYFIQYALVLFFSLSGILFAFRGYLGKALLLSLIPAFMELFIGLDKLVNYTYYFENYSLIDMIFSFTIFTSITLIALSLRDTLKELEQDENKSAFKSNKEYPYAVELINVTKDYVVGPYVVHALRGITMRVRKGEFIAIMGPSGSGKSTLLNMIGAIDKPTSGKVLVNGVDISKLSDNELAELRNREIGFVFQAYNLINRTTVLRNVELPAIVSGISRTERVKRAKKLLALVGLKDEIYRSPKYLSGGQQQRVAIARALMNNPSLILADEPTGNLDSKSGKEVMLYLRKLNDEFGTTVIVVTHDRSVAEMADRILYIRDGKIIKEEILRSGEKHAK